MALLLTGAWKDQKVILGCQHFVSTGIERKGKNSFGTQGTACIMPYFVSSFLTPIHFVVGSLIWMHSVSHTEKTSLSVSLKLLLS